VRKGNLINIYMKNFKMFNRFMDFLIDIFKDCKIKKNKNKGNSKDVSNK